MRWQAVALFALAAVWTVPAGAAALARSIGDAVTAAAQDPALERTGNAADVRLFYELRDNRPAWLEDGGWTAQARAAMAVLEGADREGLSPRDYLITGIAARTESDAEADERSDVLLTAGLLRYIGDVRTGRTVPSQVNRDNAVYPERGDTAAALAQGLAASDFGAWLESLPPADPRYRRLRAALASFRAIAAGGGWPRLPGGPTLRAGDQSAEIAVLREMLTRLGDLRPFGGAPAQEAEAEEFDAAVDFAVRRFQLRHGLKVDGAVGRNTRAALAVSPQQRAAQIAANLERLRWFAGPASGRHVAVNAAGFELDAFDGGKLVAKMPVIVGTAKDPTPVFADVITAVTFMPTWTVPPKIARNEMLPKIKRDPDYFADRNMKVYSGWGADACEVDPRDINWQSISPAALEHRIVQQPGEANALGRIRFTLGNEFGVFMHDTPGKKLFEQEQRAFSHGCVRVGDAAGLAAFVFAGDPAWPPAAIAAAMDGGETKTVALPEPVPVEMTYLTAWVDEAGIVQFRNDIYRRDAALIRALGGGI